MIVNSIKEWEERYWIYSNSFDLFVTGRSSTGDEWITVYSASYKNHPVAEINLLSGDVRGINGNTGNRLERLISRNTEGLVKDDINSLKEKLITSLNLKLK